MTDFFGARALRSWRVRLLRDGISSLPKGWQRNWAAQRIISTLPWANMRAIRRVYEEAERKTKATGVKWTVGHIVPLNHPRVCGLHVEWHGELFNQPEQLRLF